MYQKVLKKVQIKSDAGGVQPRPSRSKILKKKSEYSKQSQWSSQRPQLLTFKFK